MKRYSTNQIRMFWHFMTLSVIAAGSFLVWIIPGVDVAPVSSAVPPLPASPAASSDSDRVTRGDITAFLASLPHEAGASDPFLSGGEQTWKAFLDTLKDRPPQVEGIITVNGAKVALIHGSRLAAGEVIDGFSIQAITESAVRLEKNGATCTVTLP